MGGKGGTVMLIYKKNWLQKKTHYEKINKKREKKCVRGRWAGAPSCLPCHPLLQWHPMATLWAVAHGGSGGHGSLSLSCSPSCHCCSPLAAISLIFIFSIPHCHLLAAVHFRPLPPSCHLPSPLFCHPHSPPCEQGLAVVVAVGCCSPSVVLWHHCCGPVPVIIVRPWPLSSSLAPTFPPVSSCS